MLKSSYVVVGSLVLFLASVAFGQSTNAAITGQVTDPTKAAVPGTTVTAINNNTNVRYESQTGASGAYLIPSIPPGDYRLQVEKQGFQTIVRPGVILNIQDRVELNFEMAVGSASETITVEGATPLIETETSSSSGVVTPQQVKEMPINGRNYLDLMQLVPGVTVNRQADQGSDNSTPVLGDRAGNSLFLMDGQNNTDGVSGGAASPFNQDIIDEFRVVTAGYKAEFGHGSGGVVNVITKSGTDQWHASGSLFHRNDGFDSSNTSGLIPEPADLNVPFLQRWDYDLNVGGPLVKSKVFVFGSAERITEARQLNFVFPSFTPEAVAANELQYDKPSDTFETRVFLKFDEHLGRHHLTQELNLDNQHITDFLPLSQATSLPSTRNDLDARHLILGFGDTVLLGSQTNPFVLTLSGQYRGEPSAIRPAHPEAGPKTVFNVFSEPGCCAFGNLGQVTFGNAFTPSNLDQKYGTFSTALGKQIGSRHNLKFGYDYQRAQVNGVESSELYNQLFATIPDYETFGPIDAGAFTLATGGVRPRRIPRFTCATTTMACSYRTTCGFGRASHSTSACAGITIRPSPARPISPRVSV